MLHIFFQVLCGNLFPIISCYRSSYPDAEKAPHGDESVEPDVLDTDGFELILPSGKGREFLFDLLICIVLVD